MQIVRATLVLAGAFMFFLGCTLLIPPQWFMDLWLWPDAPWLSYVFMAAVCLSFSFGYFMVAYQAKWRPLRTIALAGLVSFGGFALYMYSQNTQAIGAYDSMRLTRWGRLTLLYAILNALYLVATENRPFTKLERIPTTLRWILGLLVAVNMWVSFRLVVGDQIFAWKLTHEMAVAYGWALMGALVLAFLACIEPYWENLWPVFATLIAYDLTLLGPIVYLLFNPTIIESNMPRTVLFLIFLLGSLATVIGYTLRYTTCEKQE